MYVTQASYFVMAVLPAAFAPAFAWPLEPLRPLRPPTPLVPPRPLTEPALPAPPGDAPLLAPPLSAPARDCREPLSAFPQAASNTPTSTQPNAPWNPTRKRFILDSYADRLRSRQGRLSKGL